LRCVISSQIIYGESAGLDQNLVSSGRQKAMALIKEYHLKDVYNLAETGLFIE
jgi:hypothetical protein